MYNYTIYAIISAPNISTGLVRLLKAGFLI